MTEHGSTLRIAPKGEREIVFTRLFDAPRAAVFEALTTPAAVQRWLTGPPGATMSVCEMDVRVGGAYRWTWENPDGTWMTAMGTFQDIAAPGRLVHTERFDPPWYPGEALITTDLAESDGRTALTAILHYESQAARDAVLRVDMAQGVAPSYDRLEAIARRRG
jgi:uncharacterized protein YndB with AHSA1/START domain